MKVLVPIDGSQCSQRTLTWLVDFLDKHTTALFLVTVLPIVPEVPLADSDFVEADALLEKAQSMFSKNGFTQIHTQSIAGFVAQTICEYATEKEIDQIIIGSHGRQGLEKFLMGSVSSEVFKTAQQPVLVFNNANQTSPSLELSHPEKPHLQV